MDPQLRLFALWFARLRSLLALKMLLFPRTLTRVFVGPPSAPTSVVMRMVGVRDLAIGVGAITGIREDTQGPEWLGWGAVADGVDGLALLVTPGLPKRARLAGLFAAGAAVVGMKLAWALADDRAQREFDAALAAAEPAA